jgi:hypothetical protein
MRAGGDGRNLPGQQYPRGRARRACRPPRHRRRSSRRRWGRRPAETDMLARAAMAVMRGGAAAADVAMEARAD